ncbi:cysteine-rich repeat secretory protein 55-like [Magnolia sinica]|uniref:cysteine-rich repeat secretory protein 55-like n=1 Tax=Magnolia sinica TaxID=86752 RepID=UPI002657D4E4|nr:cysteine-rich repeat secretory protein 55-like [Magnolia sinica]
MALFYHLLIFFLLTLAKSEDRLAEFCNNDKTYTRAKTSSNIDNVLSQLVVKTPLSGFANTSFGSGQDAIYGLAQCRGDVSTEECVKCTADAAKQIRQVCTNQADARIWFDFCFLRYDTEDFVGKLDTSFGVFYFNVENATDPEAFVEKLGGLMDRVRAQGVGPTSRGLGKDKLKFSPFVTIYALVQCTGDLSRLSCAQCLATAVSSFHTYCEYRKGCRVLYSSCYVRYEIYPFFFPLDSSKKAEGSYSRAIVHP